MSNISKMANNIERYQKQLLNQIQRVFYKNTITEATQKAYLATPRHQFVKHYSELGTDTDSFASALKHALRHDPDVIIVGEMRDLETMATAVAAAETGHLVLGSLLLNVPNHSPLFTITTG